MLERNDQIAVDKFKDGINDNIQFIIDIAYKAGKIAGITEQIKNEDRPNCEGCRHFDDICVTVCYECARLQRSDLYEGNYDFTCNQ